MRTATPDRPTEPRPVDTRPTPVTWALTYVPFGLGLVVALLGAEVTQDLRLFRAINSIRLSMALSIVALALFPHRHRSSGFLNFWRLTWTFGFIAYAIHFLYSWFGVFGGQVATADAYPTTYGFPEGAHPLTFDLVLKHQGELVLYSNFVVTGLWALDALLAWAAERARGFFGWLVGAFHLLAWLHVLISFGVATILFAKNSVAATLGYVLIGSIVLSLLAWFLAKRRPGIDD